MRFKDKVAVVAGGGGGIGQGIAVALGAEGAKVAIWDVNEAGARDTEKQIKDKGGQACVMKVDAFQYSGVTAARDQVLAQFGQIDIMVCTIGGGIFKPLKDMTPNFWQQQLDYNVKTVFNCNHAMIEPMSKRNCGKILNFVTGGTGSVASGAQALAGYSAGKTAVKSLTESMAAALAPYKVNVNCMSPGVVLTPLTRGAYAAMGPAGEKALEQSIKANPWGMNTPEGVAKIALFLLSDDAERVTGQTIHSR